MFKCDYNLDRFNPTIIKEQPTIYTVKVGENVLMPCEIENPKHYNVIWQYSISKIPETLTIGNFYYRKDLRIRVIVNQTSEESQSWNLEIRKVRYEDEGNYLCKVMAESGTLLRTIYLRVEVEMSIEPMNPEVSHNAALTLFCNTSFTKNDSNKLAAFKRNLNRIRVFWYKDGVRLNNEHHDHNGTNTSLSYRIHYLTSPSVGSRLKIFSLNSTNYFGKYTCKFRYQNVSTVVLEKTCNLFFLAKLFFNILKNIIIL
jgi:hypothetical protein